VIGRSFEFDLLTAVSQLAPALVDHGLRRLQELYLVQPGADPVTFDFRHALIRDVLYGDIPVPERRRLHRRVASAAAERGYRDAFVSAHFDQAGLAEPAYRHAVAAAGEAVALSAHREALELYRRAQRNLPARPAPRDHAALLTAIGGEAAASDENSAALEAYEQAHRLLTGIGDHLEAAAVVTRLVPVAHLLGEDLAGRVRRLELALDSVPPGPGTGPVRAGLLSALAAAYMLDRRLDEAIGYGEQSLALTAAAGDETAGLDTSVTVGSVLVFAGRMDEGWAMLESAVGRGADRRLEAEAARGYRMIGSSASVLVEYDRAEDWLGRGIDYAERVEMWNHRHYMAAHLAHVQWARGRWELADQTAEHALADGRGGITTRITAEHVLGYLAMGRGDRGHAASAAVGDAAYLFPFLLTGVRARLAGAGAGDAGTVARRGRRGADHPLHSRHPGRRRPRPGPAPAGRRRPRRRARDPGARRDRMARAAPVLGGHLGPARPGTLRRQGAATGRSQRPRPRGPRPGRPGDRAHDRRRGRPAARRRRRPPATRTLVPADRP
jgi:tetratricopeptide (TPR) repeat protein